MKSKTSFNKKTPSRILLTTLYTMALAATSAHAATYTWNGLAGNGDWNTPGNWDGNLIPVDTDGGVSGLDQQNGSDRIIISATAPTGGVPIFSGGNAFGGNTSNTPQIDMLLGTMTVSVNTWNGQGLVHRGGNWNSSVGDGITGNGLAVLNYNVVQGANALNRDNNFTMSWIVNADGTLNIDSQGSTLGMSYSATRTIDFNLAGGTVNFTKAINLKGHLANVFDFTADGASVTADFGGSFGDINSVLTAIGNNEHFISTNSLNLQAVDNGDSTFTVSVVPVPEPSSIALLGLGGISLILRRRR